MLVQQQLHHCVQLQAGKHSQPGFLLSSKTATRRCAQAHAQHVLLSQHRLASPTSRICVVRSVATGGLFSATNAKWLVSATHKPPTAETAMLSGRHAHVPDVNTYRMLYSHALQRIWAVTACHHCPLLLMPCCCSCPLLHPPHLQRA
jgi:hypothetical protein